MLDGNYAYEVLFGEKKNDWKVVITVPQEKEESVTYSKLYTTDKYIPANRVIFIEGDDIRNDYEEKNIVLKRAFKNFQGASYTNKLSLSAGSLSLNSFPTNKTDATISLDLPV